MPDPATQVIAGRAEMSLQARLAVVEGAGASDQRLPSPDQANAALQGAVSAYRQQREREAIGHGMLTANRWLVMGSIGVGTIVAPPVGVLAQVSVAATTYMLDGLFESTINSFATHAATRAEEQLAAHLRSLRDEHGLQLDTLASIDLADARQLVFGEPRGLLAQLDGMELHPDEREVVEAHLRAQFEDAITRRLALDTLADSARDRSIDELQGSVKDLVATRASLIDFQSEATVRMQAMAEAVEGLSTQLVDLHHDVGNIRGSLDQQARSIGVLESYVFARMSPDEQISALERGMFPDMPPEQRRRQVAQIKLVEHRRQVLETTQKVLNGVDILATVAERAGVDRNFVLAVKTAARWGSTAVGVATSVSRGDWIGAIGSMVGAFGGGVDVATSRHQQVMAALHKLHENQIRMLENQRIMMEQQRIIIENQQKIFEKLQDIVNQIAHSHETIMNALGELRTEVRVNREVILEVLRRELNAAERFLALRERPGFDFDRRRGRFRRYTALQEHYSSYPDQFKSAAEGIESWFARQDRVHAIFQLVSHPGALQNVSVDEVERVYALLVTVLAAAGQTGGHDLLASCAGLTTPSRSARHVGLKLAALRATPIVGRTDELTAIRDTLATPLAVEPIHSAARWALQTHHYFQLFDRPFGELLQPDELAERRSFSPRGRHLLDDVRRLVDAAIAQQALYAGDVIINYLVSTLRGLKDDGRTDQREEDAIELLHRNPLLRDNVLRLVVAEALADAGANPFVLDVAMRIPDAGIVATLLPGPWTVKHDKAAGTWSLRIESSRTRAGAFEFTLPDVDRIADSTLQPRPELAGLLELREQLFAASFTYDVGRQLEDGAQALVLAAASAAAAG